MAVTKEDLQAFHRFAGEKLDHGGAQSLVELADDWESGRREMEETVADIRQSHNDINASRVTSASDTFADVRRQLGLG